jgi:hypothetical protein
LKRVLFKATSRFLTPYVKLTKLTGKSWVLEISVVEQLLQFRFPFRLPRSFLGAKNKNELRVKLLLIQSLAVSDLQKTFDVQEFFYQISTSNTQMIQVKKQFIDLLQELVQDKIIKFELEIILKSENRNQIQVKQLTTSMINRRIHYLEFYEIID